MKVKKVYKYGTGEEIPKGAVYLNTKTETKTAKVNRNGDTETINLFVWHYFLVEVEQRTKNRKGVKV